MMFPTTAMRSLLLICLLPSAAQENVDAGTLASIIENFENVLGGEGQYAVAFRVEKEKCLAGSYSGLDLIEEAKNKIQNVEVTVSNNLIAAKPKSITMKSGVVYTEHSEFRLKDGLKELLNVRDKCVVYFTVNSPCLSKCLAENGQYNIEDSLRRLQNYEGIKAFVFKKIWTDDKNKDVIGRLKEIAPRLPFYQCNNKACVNL